MLCGFLLPHACFSMVRGPRAEKTIRAEPSESRPLPDDGIAAGRSSATVWEVLMAAAAKTPVHNPNA